MFSDPMEEFMDKGMEIEDYYSQLKRIESCPADERIKRLRIEYSADFLQYCIDHFASFPFQIPDIR